MKLTAPDGTRWKVGRQWWPERGPDPAAAALADVPAGGGGDGSWFDLADADEFVVVVVAIGAVLLAVLFFTTVVIPGIVFTVELIVLIVLFFAGLVGRLLFRRPWTVGASTGGRTRHRRQVVGFRNSGELRDEIAEALRTGRPLPPATPPPR